MIFEKIVDKVRAPLARWASPDEYTIRFIGIRLGAQPTDRVIMESVRSFQWIGPGNHL